MKHPFYCTRYKQHTIWSCIYLVFFAFHYQLFITHFNKIKRYVVFVIVLLVHFIFRGVNPFALSKKMAVSRVVAGRHKQVRQHSQLILRELLLVVLPVVLVSPLELL